jgi:hypothetical protein
VKRWADRGVVNESWPNKKKANKLTIYLKLGRVAPTHSVFVWSYGPWDVVVSLATALNYIRAHDFYIMPIVLEIKNIESELTECR